MMWPTRALLFSLVAACGGGGDGDSGETDAAGTTGATGSGLPTTGDSSVDPQVERLCHHLFSCGCDVFGYLSEAACISSFTLQIQIYQGAAMQSGLIYDPVCFEKNVDYNVDVIGCKTADEVAALPSICDVCASVRGDKAEGAACGKPEGVDFDDCGPGLICQSGVCIDRCEHLSAGEICRDESGLTISACDDELFCAADRTCRPIPGAGEACPESVCAADFTCDEVCVPAGELGDPCDHGCVTGLRCDGVMCSPLPDAGQPCNMGSCAAGLYCTSEAVCAEPGAAGAACVNDVACVMNTQCSDGACVEQAASWCVVGM